MEAIREFVERYLSEYRPYKQYWNYEDGCVLTGCVALYRATGEARLRDFVLGCLEELV